MLAEAWKDITGREATVSHDNYLGRIRREKFGDFVEFIEHHVKHLLEASGPPIWWPTSRLSVIDDVLYRKTERRSERARARVRALSRQQSQRTRPP